MEAMQDEIVLVQRELDKSLLQLRDNFGKEVFLSGWACGIFIILPQF